MPPLAHEFLMAAWTQRMVDAPDAPLLKPIEVAELLGYSSASSLRELIKLRQLPRPLKKGGVNVWTWQDVLLARLIIEAGARFSPAGKKPPGEGSPKPVKNLPRPAKSG